ncbi:MAG: cupin domain-containing protein [Gammaproteobacteria bacterium]|nr:cupin domain-containing protein [Gammaproteobacteria bacterium]
MQTLLKIPETYQHTSPAGAEVRLLMNSHLGGIAHCTLKAGKITLAVQHKTVSEFWHVLSGKGAIWRKMDGHEEITPLETGATIEIPVGAQFQYRSDAAADLVFLCVTMPPWSGADEAKIVDQGGWTPT